MEERYAEQLRLCVQHFNESSDRADQNMETRSGIIAVARNGDKEWLQDCERALVASR